MIVGGIDLKWRVFESSGGSVGLWVPVDPDRPFYELAQNEFAVTDERLPYFTMIWPAAEALARRVLAGSPLHGLAAIDLGCGLGLVGLAAAARGARVTFLDWEPRALEIVAESARALGPLDRFRFVTADWRDAALDTFDLILGADILYEGRNVRAVAIFLARHLSDAGEAYIADPGRLNAASLPREAAGAGLTVVAADKDAAGITVYRVAK